METLYSTTDFYTTAVLIEQKFDIKSITREKSNGEDDFKGKVRRFYFQDSPELQQTILNYINKKLKGDLRGFRDAIESVKDLIHQNK